MLQLETLTQAEVTRFINDSSIKKARSYLTNIRNPQRKGNRLSAQVRGSSLYEVEIEVGANSIDSVCTCSWGGNCKHVGAVLLMWLQTPRTFTVVEQRESPPPPKDGYLFDVVQDEPPPTVQPKQLPGWMQLSFDQRRQLQRQDLERVLQTMMIDEMRAIAESCNWKIKGTRKADLAQQLTERLLDPVAIKQQIDALDAEHHRVLVAIALMGNISQQPYAILEEIASSWGTLTKYKKLPTYLEHLKQSGLILLNGNATFGHYGEHALIHQARNALLPPLLSGMVASNPDLPDGPAGSELLIADGNQLIQSVEQLLVLFEHTPTKLEQPLPRPAKERYLQRIQGWDFDPNSLYDVIESGSLKPNQSLTLKVALPTRFLAEEARQRFAPIMGGEQRLDFLTALLVSSGVVQPGSPVTVWPQVKTEFFRQNDPARRAILARTYFQLASWSELWEVMRQNPKLALNLTIPYYDTPKRADSLDKLLVHYRRMVLCALSLLPDNEWISLSDLCAFLQKWWRQFNHKFWSAQVYSYGMGNKEQQNGLWHIAIGNEPLKGAQVKEWEQVQGSFVRFMLQGPLHWLGLADLHQVNDTLTHVRLHNLADLFFDRVEAPALAAPLSKPKEMPGQATTLKTASALSTGALEVAGDLIRVVPNLVGGRAHSLLERIAKLESTDARQFVYRLDVATVHRSFEAGVTLSELQSEWKERFGSALPTSLAKNLQTWWNSYGQVRVYQDLTIIELGDDHALTEMKAVTSLSKVMLAELSPRLVIIPKSALEPLVSELEKAGYTPKRES